MLCRCKEVGIRPLLTTSGKILSPVASLVEYAVKHAGHLGLADL